MKMKSVGRNKKSVNNSGLWSEEESLLKMGPHLLDVEVEPFCQRVSEFGNIIQGLKSKNEWEQKNAIRRADVLLHGGSGEGSFDNRHPCDKPECVVTSAGDGPKIGTKNQAEPSTGCDLKHGEDFLDQNSGEPIYKVDVLLEDCSDDEISGSKPPAEHDVSIEALDEDELVQPAEEQLLELLVLPEQEESTSRKRSDADAISRKQESDIYRQMGTAAFAAESFADSVLNYTKAIELLPENSYLYMNRAQAYLRVGIPQLALEDLKTAIELNPNSLKAHLLKARTYFSLSDPDKARTFLNYLKQTFAPNIGMINAFEKDLFDLKMEKHFETSEETRQREELRMKNRIPLLSDLEEKWQKLGRHELFELENLKDDDDQTDSETESESES